MKITVLTFATIILSIASSGLCGQSAHKHLRNGNQQYQEQQYMMAEESYRRALEKKPSLKGAYNLGNTLYNQKRYEEAAQQFEDAISKAKDKSSLSQAFYNKGNALLEAQNFNESIEAYKNSLLNNPNSLEAKQNLFIAKRMLQQQQQQEQEQQQQENEQQQQENEENKEQQEQEQQQQNENQQQQQQEQQQEQENEEKQDLDKKDAARLLEIVENEEKKVQEKMRRTSGKKTKSKKDW